MSKSSYSMWLSGIFATAVGFSIYTMSLWDSLLPSIFCLPAFLVVLWLSVTGQVPESEPVPYSAATRKAAEQDWKAKYVSMINNVEAI
ncbi:hypothetical protein AGMMS49938_07210 [Fibrobacterales bacterium]|nr:hypothetical protein AGMMS49938_07210 [Fibrobacterales bacterium]